MSLPAHKLLGSQIKKYIQSIGWILALIAILVIIGWIFDIILLKSLLPNLTPMNPLTALTFIVGGYWLIQFNEKQYKRSSTISALFILFVGTIHFLSYLLEIDSIRFDDLIFQNKIENSLINSHMAPITTVLFVFSGITMLSAQSKRKWLVWIHQTMSIATFIIAYASTLGYIYGRDSAYVVEGVSTIALSTAILFLLMSTGLFLSNVSQGLPKLFVSMLEGSVLFRRGIIFILIFTSLLGYLRIKGELLGLYSTERGAELFTVVLTITGFVAVYFYALILNNKQKRSIQLERQLKQNELKFRTLVSSLREGVASIDYEGRILYCNPSYCKILGYKEEELIGKVVVDMIIPIERRKEFYERLESRKLGISENYQTEIIKKTGEKITIEIKSNTLSDYENNGVAYVVSINDITEEIRQLEDIKAFSSSAAHDLNNPINKIMTVVVW